MKAPYSAIIRYCDRTMSGVYEHLNILCFVLSSSGYIFVACRDSALHPASHCQMVASYDVPIIIYIDTAIMQVSGIYDYRIMAYRDELI